MCFKNTYSQTQGTVLDVNTKEPIVGAKVISSDGNKAITDFDGYFEFKNQSYPVDIVISMLEYVTDTIRVVSPQKLTVLLKEPVTDLETVVVSAGRRKQSIEEVPISMEIIKPELIDNKGLANLEQVVDQSQAYMLWMVRLVFEEEEDMLMELVVEFFFYGMESQWFLQM